MNEVTVPYEFAFLKMIPFVTSHEDFLRELSSLLYDIWLKNMLDVRLLDSYDLDRSMKVTEGKTNIMMSREFVPDADFIEALWVFFAVKNQSCHCRKYCFTRNESMWRIMTVHKSHSESESLYVVETTRFSVLLKEFKTTFLCFSKHACKFRVMHTYFFNPLKVKCSIKLCRNWWS